MTSYAVVVFIEEDGVAVVPEEWCIGTDRCYWPPYKTIVRFERAVRSCEPHKEDWQVYDIRILSTTHSYEKAQSRMRKAEDTSDLQTDAEDNLTNRKRQRRANPRFITSDTSEEEAETGPSLHPQPPPAIQLGLPTIVSLETTTPITTPPPPVTPSASTSRGTSGRPLPLPIMTSPPPVTPSGSTARGTSRRLLSSPISTPPPPLTPSSSGTTSRETSGRLSSVSSVSPSTPQRGTQPTATERLLLKMLTEVKTDVRDLKEVLRRMRSTMRNAAQHQEEDNFVLPEGIVLPCSSMEELKELDSQLKTNRALQGHMRSLLSAAGGNKLREVVRRMMSEIMTNDVAVRTNWTGQGDKTAFADLALRPLLEKAARRNPPTAGCTNADVKAEVGYYLKGASDRDGGRQARRRPVQQNAAPQ